MSFLIKKYNIYSVYSQRVNDVFVFEATLFPVVYKILSFVLRCRLATRSFVSLYQTFPKAIHSKRNRFKGTRLRLITVLNPAAMGVCLQIRNYLSNELGSGKLWEGGESGKLAN